VSFLPLRLVVGWQGGVAVSGRPAAAEIVAATCHAQDYGDAGKRAVAWDDHQACGAVVSAVVGDATTIVHALRQATLNEILGAFVHVHLNMHKKLGLCMFVSFIACCHTLKGELRELIASPALCRVHYTPGKFCGDGTMSSLHHGARMSRVATLRVRAVSHHNRSRGGE
jgi:hypothetical protein